MAGQKQQKSVGGMGEESSLNENRGARSVVEGLHRQFLDVVKDDLDRACHGDLAPGQAVLDFNIGDTG